MKVTVATEIFTVKNQFITSKTKITTGHVFVDTPDHDSKCQNRKTGCYFKKNQVDGIKY